MIEIVYKDEAEEEGQGRNVKTPKNVKQIGEEKGKRRIYIEDYVMNFVKKAPNTGKEAAALRYGVLLGKVQRGEGTSFIFVQGAAEAAPIETDESEQEKNNPETGMFSGDAWNGIYDEIKRYFDQMEIVGWYLSKPEQQSHEMPWINKVHLDNFSGIDKLFLSIDRSEKEETFYAFDGTGLEKEEGYYIYYDRNEEMQQYMASKEPVPEIKSNVDDEKQKKTVSFSVSSLLAVAALLAVVLLLNNYDGIAGLLGRENNNSQINVENGTDAAEAGNRVEQPNASGESETGGSTTGTEIETVKTETDNTDENGTQGAGDTETDTKAASTGLETRYYTVQQGETLYEICMRVYNNPSMVDTVRELNGLDDDYLIIEGQKIILP